MESNISSDITSDNTNSTLEYTLCDIAKSLENEHIKISSIPE